jgi:hypothetical protein
MANLLATWHMIKPDYHFWCFLLHAENRFAVVHHMKLGYADYQSSSEFLRAGGDDFLNAASNQRKAQTH